MIIITGLIVSTIILALRKWGFFNWYGAHLGHIKWLPAYDCYLCIGFWMAGFFHFPVAILAILVGDYYSVLCYFLIPFASTAISTLITHAIITD